MPDKAKVVTPPPPTKAIATPIVSTAPQNGVPSPPSTTVPALPKPELPKQAAITVNSPSDTIVKDTPATLPATATAIPVVKNADNETPIEAKNNDEVLPPRNVSANPLTAIVMGKSAILTRQHKQRIRIKYSNLRNPALKSTNVLNEHNVRNVPPRKKEPIATAKKADIPSKATPEAANENGKPNEEPTKLANAEMPVNVQDNVNADTGKLASPTTSSNAARKAKKKARKIAVNKNTKLRVFESGKDKLWACRHCGKRYRWKSTLRRHENDECGNKEPSHQCPYCPYKAKQRGNLGVHVRKHHADKPKLESSRKRRTV